VLLRPSLDHHSNYMQCVENTVLIRLLIIISVTCHVWNTRC